MKLIYIVAVWLLASNAFADAAEQLVVENPFVRAAIIQQRNSAVFMQLQNPVASTAVVAASSPVAEVVELHTHINDQGVMRMRKISQIELPAAKTVSLQPGGLHVMLLGLKRDLKPGDSIELTLVFSDNSEKQLQIPVQKVSMHKMKQMQEHRMDGSLPPMMKH
jgi:copper(I)-binding protein